MKTWTLRNAGTCTWTPDYSLVYIKGEQMSGTSPSPIGQTVHAQWHNPDLPAQKAPENPGEYQAIGSYGIAKEGFWSG